MGMIHAKCPKCWDTYPCSCGITDPLAGIGRNSSSDVARALEEQNRIGKEILEELRKKNNTRDDQLLSTNNPMKEELDLVKSILASIINADATNRSNTKE